MNQEFLYIIIIIALGYLLKRLNILKEKDGEVISKIIFKISLPALVLVTFDSVKIETSLILLPVIVLIYGLITACLGLLVFKNEERELKGSFLMLSGFNVGLFAFPLVFAIWGMEGLTYFSMFDVGTSFVVFGIAYILGSYFSAEGLKLKPIEILKKLGKSIPLMTYLIASILNFSHIQLPDTIINVASTISKANMPLSLLLLGLYLNFKLDKQFIKPMLKFLTFRYGLGLLFGFGLYLFLPYNQMYRFTVLIGLLLPVAASALTFAVEFKYSTSSTRLIATISNITILISIAILYTFANFIL
ncbi:AEC family transporter [Neobacillus sp. OS1-33]|jgi:predicted permease|uniref:AEC family transporter n=1 Tax=Neobacillus sp. OS1-33 TaxID=3070683 RepID=UPI0027DEAD31|nr:AEC family transporter [Neobacillus sp. OS1-33]WML23873.1 AEC family transporter [Neobacillus sp. OS1-33]